MSRLQKNFLYVYLLGQLSQLRYVGGQIKSANVFGNLLQATASPDYSSKGPDMRLARYALGLSRQHLRVLTGLLTGHATLNRHLAVMKIRTDPICSACSEEDETAIHFLGSVLPLLWPDILPSDPIS